MIALTPGVCTVIYSPPEMFLGRQLDEAAPPAHASAQSIYSNSRLDIWSIGTILFEMLSGMRLVEAEDRASIVQIVQKRIGEPSDGALAKVVREYTRVPVRNNLACSGTKSLQQLAEKDEGKEGWSKWSLATSMLTWEVMRRPSAKEAHAKLMTQPCGVPSHTERSSQPISRAEDAKPSFGSCRCKGRCRNGVCVPLDTRQYRPGKVRTPRPCPQLAISPAGLCRACTCVRPGCTKARERGVLCFADQKALTEMSWSLQMAHAIHTCRFPAPALAQGEDAKGEDDPEEAEPAVFTYVDNKEAESFLPCDVMDFLSHETTARKSLLNALLLAYIKEPAATVVYSEADAGKPSDGKLTDVVLEQVFTAMDGKRTIEAEQVSRQGVSRWMGTAAVGRTLGMLTPLQGKTWDKKRPSEARVLMQRKRVKLGLTGREYAVSPSSAIFENFRSRCAALTGEWESIWESGEELQVQTGKIKDLVHGSRIGKLLHASTTADYEKRAKAIFAAMPKKNSSSSKKSASAHGHAQSNSGSGDSGYLADFGMRKLILLLLKNRTVDWEQISMQELKVMSADQGDVLETVPASWSSKEPNSLQFSRKRNNRLIISKKILQEYVGGQHFNR
jgi:hypothetical protein